MSRCSNPCVWRAEELDGRSHHRSRATPLSWAELGGETQALKVSFHLEDSLSPDRLASSSPFFSDISSLRASGWPTPNLLRLHVISWSPAWPCGPSSLLSLLWYGPPRPRWKEPVSVGRRCKTSGRDMKGQKSCGPKTEKLLRSWWDRDGGTRLLCRRKLASTRSKYSLWTSLWMTACKKLWVYLLVWVSSSLNLSKL